MTLARTKLIQAVCTFALAGHALAVAADTVVLNNGDSLTGTIISHTEQELTLQHPVLGNITIQASRVASIKREPDDEATANPADTEQLQALTPAAPETKPDDPKAAALTKQAAIDAAKRDRSIFQTIVEDWNSRLALGLNGSSGPTDKKDYRIKFNTSFEDTTERVAFDTSWYYSSANGKQSQNQVQANITKDWLVPDKPWFYFLKGQYKFDNNRSWENRTSAFGGGGYTVAKTEDVEFNTRLGFGGTYEYGSVNEFTPEALFGGSVIKWNLTDRATISGETIYFPSLDDAAQFRIESSIEWTYKLDMADGLAIKLGIENEYDSQTTNENNNSDLRYYAAIVLSF